ncbi:hypothetical protein LTR28_009369 [Elasticomyces elasticus]|nr:hypothetical protein LTR28_009369 [Elasticomyces elasticus]
MQGQSNHFTRYAPEKIEYGVNRYQNETRRLYGVLDKHLRDTKQDYLVGNKCTIADIAHFGWVAAAFWAGIDIEEFPTLKAWEDRMYARPGVEKGTTHPLRLARSPANSLPGRHVPDPHKMKELSKDKEAMERHAKQGSQWVQKGMKEDAQRQK